MKIDPNDADREKLEALVLKKHPEARYPRGWLIIGFDHRDNKVRWSLPDSFYESPPAN